MIFWFFCSEDIHLPTCTGSADISCNMIVCIHCPGSSNSSTIFKVLNVYVLGRVLNEMPALFGATTVIQKTIFSIFFFQVKAYLCQHFEHRNCPLPLIANKIMKDGASQNQQASPFQRVKLSFFYSLYFVQCHWSSNITEFSKVWARALVQLLVGAYNAPVWLWRACRTLLF